MPKIPLTSLNLAPQGQGGVNPPDTGLISDAIGKAIQSAGMDRARGAMAVAEGEMAKGKAIAGIGASIANVAEAFVALGEKEKRLNGIETSIAFDKDLLQFYADQDEFERLNASNPIDKNGNNIFMMNAQKGLSMLQKKYGEKALDQNTAARIAGQISDASVRVPVAARTSALKTRADNINSEFKVKMDSKDFVGAAALNDQLKTEGIISDSKHAENKSALDINQKNFTIEQTRKEIDAFLLDSNPKAAEEKLKTLEPLLTPEEFQIEQSTFVNKNGRAAAINGMADQIVTDPRGVRTKVLKELERRKKDPEWKTEPGGDEDLKFLDTSDLDKIKKDINDSVAVKAQSELATAREAVKNFDGGMTQSEFIERFDKEFPNLLTYDEGQLAGLLYGEYQGGGTLKVEPTIGYITDQIAKLDFTDQTPGGIAERALVQDLIDTYTEENIQSELKARFTSKKSISENPKAQPINAAIEQVIDEILSTNEIITPGVDIIVPAQPAVPGSWFFGMGAKEAVPERVMRPGKYKEVPIVGPDGTVDPNRPTQKRFVPDYSDTEESKKELYKKDIANTLKAQMLKNLEEGKYTQGGVFNKDVLIADINAEASKLIRIVSPEGKVTKPGQTTSMGQEAPPAYSVPSKPEDTSSDVDFPVPPAVKAIEDTGADVPVPAPPGATPPPTPEPPGAIQTRGVSKGVGAAESAAATTPPVNTPMPGYGPLPPGSIPAGGAAVDYQKRNPYYGTPEAAPPTPSPMKEMPPLGVAPLEMPGAPMMASPQRGADQTSMASIDAMIDRALAEKGVTPATPPAAPETATPAAPTAPTATLPAGPAPATALEGLNVTGDIGIPGQKSFISPEMDKKLTELAGEQAAPAAASPVAGLFTAPEGGYKYVVDTRTRDQLESMDTAPGNRIVSLDYNYSDKGANYAMIVIPNDATPEEREAAQLYVDTLHEWFISNGVEVNKAAQPVKTSKENKRGTPGFFHTEPAFQQNVAAMELLRDKADEHAAILAGTLGTLPGVRFIAPHKSDDGGAPGYKDMPNERDFARQYTLPSLQKVLSGEIKPITVNTRGPAAAVPTAVTTGGTVDYLSKVGAATKINVTTSTTPVLEGPVIPLNLPMTVREAKKDDKIVYVASANDVYNYALERFKNSPLKGMSIEDGADYGIVKGTPEEWATFITKLIEKESSFVIDTLGDEGKYVGGSNGLGQLSPKDGGNKVNYTFGKDFTKEELKNPLFNLEATIRVVEALISKDKVIRKDSRGTARYFPNTLRNHRSVWKDPVTELE